MMARRVANAVDRLQRWKSKPSPCDRIL